MAPPQTAASGSDGQYRMTVDAKYSQTAAARKHLHFWAVTLAIFNLIRSTWHTFPWALYGQTTPPLNIAVMVTGVFAYLFYLSGSGFGNPRDQNPEKLLIFAILAGVNAILVGGAFLQYHLRRTTPLPHLELAGSFINPDMHAMLWMIETISDILGMGVGIEAAKQAFQYFSAVGYTKPSKPKSN